MFVVVDTSRNEIILLETKNVKQQQAGFYQQRPFIIIIIIVSIFNSVFLETLSGYMPRRRFSSYRGNGGVVWRGVVEAVVAKVGP